MVTNPLFISHQWWGSWMAFPSSLWRNLVKLTMSGAWIDDLWPQHHSKGTIRQCLIHLAMISPSCHPENGAFLPPFYLVPLKVNQHFPFLLHLSPDNSMLTFPALKLWFMFVPGTVQVSREGHADTSKKETNCPVLINSSCPSVTFHSTLF